MGPQWLRHSDSPPLAIHPAEAIEAHRAFISRRRALRPVEEYRTPTDAEWEDFLGHFERRKLSVGTCARAYGTVCIHEHACVRCSLLRPDPAPRARLAEIRGNLIARIAEAETEGWLGEIEGLQVSLAGAEEKLRQLDAEQAGHHAAVDLGIPTTRGDRRTHEGGCRVALNRDREQSKPHALNALEHDRVPLGLQVPSAASRREGPGDGVEKLCLGLT